MRSLKTNILLFRSLLKTISFRRVINFIKSLISYCLSVALKRPVLAGMPWSITIEPTNLCNLSCPECPTGTRGLTRPTGSIEPELFRKIIDESKGTAFFLNFYFQGEPFLHKNLTTLIGVAKENRFFTSCATNAHFINEDVAKKIVASGLDHLVISFDGTTQETYEKYRVGGEIDKVKKGIAFLVKEKKEQRKRYPVIVLQFLILKHNAHQIEEAREIAWNLGADQLVYKTAQLYDLNPGNPLLPENPLHSRYVKTPEGKLELKRSQKNRCWKLWSTSVITWDGRLVPCCFDKDAHYCFGSLDKNSLSEIIFSEEAREFKKKVLNNRNGTDICSNCSE
jgi:radical SAM protein with 4Fe4S-binding SPASM domain